MKRHGWMLGVLAASALQAQDLPLQRPDERIETQRQSAELYDVVKPVARQAGKSTVWVWGNRRQLALGTVIGDGTKVLTKWSEIAFAQTPIQVVGGDGKTASATVLGVYQEEDIALLQLEGAVFPPIEWSQQETPELGRFLVAASPDDFPLSIGVVAVKERALKGSGPAFLGVQGDTEFEGEGVRVRSLVEKGGAEAAGIKAGDVIVSVAGKEVADFPALATTLRLHAAGQKVVVSLMRDGTKMEFEVELHSTPYQQVPEARLSMMRQMGGDISVRGADFPAVIQTDMQLKPSDCGGPVVDLDGNVVGMSISRTDRTRSFIISAKEIVGLLGEEPVQPQLADLGNNAGGRVSTPPGRTPQGRAVPVDPGAGARLRQHLEEMQSLLDRMNQEMGTIRP